MSFARIRFLHTEFFRLCAIYAAIFACSVLILGGFVLVITDHAFRDQIVKFSQADIAAIQDGYESENLSEAVEVIHQRMANPGASDYFLLEHGNERLAGNLSPMLPRIGTISLPGATADHDILGVGAFLAPGLYAFAGSDLYRVHMAQNQIIRTMVWLLGLALILAVAGGTLLSRSFLSRSDAMDKACRAIMNGDLKARIPVRGTQDELDRLATTINQMLDRISDLMQNLRQVTNDIAHDLRTPVTHLRHRLERARNECSSVEQYSAALDSAITKADEILMLFAALLRIAQIEGGARRAAFTPVEWGPIFRQLGDMFDAVAEESEHRLEIKSCDHGLVRGDRALLVQMLSNLIENAILHTPPGTQISVSLAALADRSVVSVSDDGPGVPREEHQKLFQRLYRREASRTRPGYGLGLSMVQAIAELHGATARIIDEPKRGFCVEIAFPAFREAY